MFISGFGRFLVITSPYVPNFLGGLLMLLTYVFVFLLVFSFYKIIKIESLKRSILYFFLYTLYISISILLGLLISNKIEPCEEMGCLALIALPIGSLIFFGIINLIILIINRIVIYYKNK
jgi:predicted neutral ceramidase superfamily lipid hydrolase